jgi:hypothetical protein
LARAASPAKQKESDLVEGLPDPQCLDMGKLGQRVGIQRGRSFGEALAQLDPFADARVIFGISCLISRGDFG